MNPRLKKPRSTAKGQDRQQRGLASLEQLFYSSGAAATDESFRAITPEAELSDYNKIRAGGGRPSFRTDVRDVDGIKYYSYSPPRSWEAPYSVQLAEFQHVPKTDFMYHGGEELLIPVSGEIMYHFYWSPGSSAPEHFQLEKPITYGSVIRINPQVPHHTWSMSEAGAKAWMFFRYLSGSPTALTVDSEYHQKPRRISEEKLKEPGRYGLVAWGLAEKIRNYRLRANFSVLQLANAVDATPSYISRIEAADTNVSLSMLASIARVLNFGLGDFISAAPWAYDVGSFSAATYSRPQKVLKKPTSGRHLLHPLVYSIGRFKSLKIPTFFPPVPGDFTTWIVLKGKVLVEFSDREPELLDEGAVIHFRKALEISIQALRPAQLMRMKFSADCRECLQREDEKS